MNTRFPFLCLASKPATEVDQAVQVARQPGWKAKKERNEGRMTCLRQNSSKNPPSPSFTFFFSSPCPRPKERKRVDHDKLFNSTRLNFRPGGAKARYPASNISRRDSVPFHSPKTIVRYSKKPSVVVIVVVIISSTVSNSHLFFLNRRSRRHSLSRATWESVNSSHNLANWWSGSLYSCARYFIHATRRSHHVV